MTIKIAVSGAFVEASVIDALTMDDLPILFEAFDDARRKGPFVLMTNTLGMSAAPLSVIKAFADRLKKFPPMKDVWLGDAVLVSSPIARFGISTLVMIAPLPTKIKVFEAREGGRQWCRYVLEAAGVEVPAVLA